MKKTLALIFFVILIITLYNFNSKEVTLKKEFDFKELKAPITNSQKMKIRFSNSVNYSNNKKDTITFKKLISAKDRDNNEVFALLKDYKDNIITFKDGSPFICDGANGNAKGSGLDHSSILHKDGKIFMVSQFECAVGGMYGMQLEQNSTTGVLSLKEGSLTYISQKEDFGGWVHCAGVTTPWQSHLGSEEYEPNARAIEENINPKTNLVGNVYYDDVTKYYWNDENNSNSDFDNNPYYYGYIPEVTVDTKTSTYNYKKHFSMGRASWELAYIMPDNKTAYISDDGTNVGFFMYVADKPKDLSSGTLYAGKWIQTSKKNGGSADLVWIKLGQATDKELKEYISTKPKFSDMFETSEVNNSSCIEGFTYVDTTAKEECLKVKEGKEKYVAFLETRRYAGVMGATTEWRKEEGITFDKESRTLFVSISEISKGMVDGKGDINIEENRCGGVYGMELFKENEVAYDSKKEVINSKYVVKNTKAKIVGSNYKTYSCDIENIANPDNITFIEGKQTLIIGEDTNHHPNDFVWSYDLKTKKLTRIISTPYGSESTSPYWYEINGFGYITLVTQHPFGEVNSKDIDYPLAKIADSKAKASSIGIFGVFKKFK